MKNFIMVLVAAFIATTAFAKGIFYQTDPLTGAITRLAIDGDTTGMNWLMSPDGKQYPWVTAQYGWGLGYLTVNGEKAAWGSLPYRAGSVAVIVERELKNGELRETYTFKNTGRQPARITDCGIYTPWNDNYTDADTCITKRCDAHLWAGGNAAHVCALRMGGGKQNVGLAVTNGKLVDYEVWQRGREMGKSNFRGVIAVCLPDTTLQPGKSYSVSWTIFEHSGKQDFMQKLQQHGSALVTSDKYIYQFGETVNIYLNRRLAKSFIADKLGEQRIDIAYGNGKTTYATILVVSGYDKLIEKRVNFILDHQVMNDTADARYGAFMVYDNELHHIYKNDDARRSYDTDEGRERVGMGVLLAEWLKLLMDTDIDGNHKAQSSKLKAQLVRYASFLRNKLQTEDYTTYSRVSKDGRNRGYNYPWIADFYFLMYDVTGDRQYALDGYGTMQALFRHFGYRFYCIDYPVTTGLRMLRQAGLAAERDTLLTEFGKVADTFTANGLSFPKSEVDFEQSIVAPAAQFLLEYYLATKNEKYLETARLMMPVVENFCGFQPHYRLHDISIRHWDCYWFGKQQLFGDTFPHYWSAVNGLAYYYYWLATGDETYLAKAQEVVRNNLCNVFEDGSASCAYVFPRRVNSEQAHFADVFANDQDWALAFYLRVCNVK